MPEPRDDIAGTIAQLESWGAEREWIGPDPYEGLNSPLGELARGKRPRQALIQLYKRTPFAPPWPLRASARPNAKVFGLVLSAYSSPAGRRLPGAGRFAGLLVDRLESMGRSAGALAWGYHFDAQTRHLFYGREEPNAIATCFAVGGLCDAHAQTGEERPAALALAARPYLLSLYREGAAFGPSFTYVAAGSELIHNANLLVCGALCRLHELEPDASAAAAVAGAAATSLALQGGDGLWAYGEAANLGWQDNFHTAYLLEGLCRTERTFGIGGEALERGVDAWLAAFVDADGWAPYFPRQRYPLEPHCSASAIDLLCLLAAHRRDAGAIETAERIATRAIAELWIGAERRFAFRRTARGLNRREFMRWTNAPMFRALCSLESARTGRTEPGPS
jgi:polysaccharide biosynthesis protein VpsJ